MAKAFHHWTRRTQGKDPSFRDAFMAGYAASNARIAIQIESEIARRHRPGGEGDDQAVTALRQLLAEMEG